MRRATARLVDIPGVEWVRADGSTGVVVVKGTVAVDVLRATLVELGLPASRFDVRADGT